MSWYLVRTFYYQSVALQVAIYFLRPCCFVGHSPMEKGAATFVVAPFFIELKPAIR